MAGQKHYSGRIESGTISQLKELAKEVGCSLKGLKLKGEIQERLRDFCSHSPSPTLWDNPGPIDMHNSSASKFVCLPLIVDEFLFMWEGGVLCHPAVLAEMARETGVELESRAYHASQELAWDIVAQISGEVRLYVSDASERLTVDWAASFQSLVRIEVDSPRSKEELTRRIQQTHQRLDADLPIQIGNVPSVEQSEVQSNSTWSVLESKGLKRMKRIDSMIGAIAVSSYVERLMLVQGKLNSSISDLGWLGSAIFQTDIWRERLKRKADRVNVDGLRRFAENANGHLNFIDEWQFDIRDTLSDWRNGEDDFPTLWSRFTAELPDEIRASIEKDMRRGLIKDVMMDHANNLTPWLMYIVLLWKHKGIRNRSSNASQSVLHTLIDFAKEGIISGQNAVLIAAYHGWHMGYQLCTASPVDWASVYGGSSHWWSLKLSSKALAAISSALITNGEIRLENQSQQSVFLNGGWILVFRADGVVRFQKDSVLTEFKRMCQTESSNRKEIHALLPGMLGALKSLTRNQDDDSAFLGPGELDKFIVAVASELELDDARGSKRRFVKMFLAGWHSTNHE